MGIGLQLANRNDFVKVEEHINNNLSNLEEMIDNNSGKKITGYIQDEGEKVLGNYYLDKLTTGLFKCIKSGNINYNSSEYFENDSNYALSDKLQNLVEIGSNSNGTYRKWADGTLECWASEKRAAITPLYSTFDFPYQFKYSNRASVVCLATDIGNGTYSYGCCAISNTQYRLYGEVPPTGTESGMAHLYFKGVWK